MAEKRDKSLGKNKYGKRRGWPPLIPFVLGGLFTYYVLIPVIDGKFKGSFKKQPGKTANTTQSHYHDYFNRIDQKTLQYKYLLFHKYFGEKAPSIFREYYNSRNYSNELNPNNGAYWQSRGYAERPENWEELIDNDFNKTQQDWDNYSNQLNPNNDAYWQSRGYDERPDDWQNQSGSGSSNADVDNHANQLNPNNDAYQGKK